MGTQVGDESCYIKTNCKLFYMFNKERYTQ